MFGAGLLLVDGDLMKREPGGSPFTLFAGPNALELSQNLLARSLVGFVPSYLCLPVALIAGMHGRSERVTLDYPALSDADGPVRP